MPDVFVLGAGLSKAIGNTMPTLSDLGDSVRRQLNLGAPADRIEADLELWLTYLSGDNPWLTEAENLRNRALLSDVSSAVGAVITERTQGVLANPCPAWLLGLVLWWHQQRSSVITLNYDTLVETAATEATRSGPQQHGVYCADLYAAPISPALQRRFGLLSGQEVDTFSLSKLHGSINWYYSGAHTYGGETIYFTRTPRQWGAAPIDLVEMGLVADKVPLIVPPLADKIPFFRHETIRGMWRRASAQLKAATRVFCLGYSLPETDLTLRYFLRDSAPAKKVGLFPVNRAAATGQHYQALLGDLYDVDVRFIGDNPIPSLYEALRTEMA